jgi:DNA-binding SARP family transcriptional activator
MKMSFFRTNAEEGKSFFGSRGYEGESPMKNVPATASSGTVSGNLSSPEQVDVDAIEDALRSAKMLLDHAVEGEALPEQGALHWQLVRQLTSLQLEYGRIRAWLDEMQAQLSQREAALRRRLQEALALSDQADAPRQARVPSPYRATVDPPLVVSLLGDTCVRYQGQEISLGSSKNGRAIFRYLIASPVKSAPTDVLLETFWPQDEPHEARHKLHIAVSTLRQALHEGLDSLLGGRDAIVYLDDRYHLLPEVALALDVDLFARHVAAGQRLEREGRAEGAMAEYEAARALYRGDLLSADLYADWAVAPRARYEEMFLTLLGRLAEHYVEQQRYADGASCCRQILARDSFREDAYRQLMRCYSRMGRRNQALREFQSCKEVLRRELGVEPMHETVELYDRIVRQEPV